MSEIRTISDRLFLDKLKGENSFETLKNKQCKGIIFRASVSAYYNGTIGQRIQLRPLKRKSCPGCEKCGWLHETLTDFDILNELPDLSDVAHGKMYKVITTNHVYDWESGYVDGFDLQLVEYTE